MSVKLRFNLARDLFNAFPIIREDMSAEPSDKPSLEFLSVLSASPTPEDAVTFCAYLLPRREAVWWGIQCLSQIPDNLSPIDIEHIKLAEAWVRQPEEPERNLALSMAIDCELKTPGVWIALAAGWSGGSMVAEDMNPVPPPPYLTAKAVKAGLLGALAMIEISGRPATLKNFIDIGAKLATGE